MKKGTNMILQRAKFEEWFSKNNIDATLEQIRLNGSCRKWYIRLGRFQNDECNAINQPKQTTDELLLKIILILLYLLHLKNLCKKKIHLSLTHHQ